MPDARLALCARGSLLLLLLATAAPGAAAPPAAHRVYLARESAQGVPEPQPADVFSCDSTVYAVAELEQLPRGQHELLAVWSDPQGKARERTPLPFHARQPKERVWVWLRLSRPAGAAAISFFDPAAGMGEFVGQWTVTLTLDGARLDTLRFKIQC